MDGHQDLFARLLDERGIAMLREPEQLTAHDLIEAASCLVDSSAAPKPFRLLP